MDFDPDELEKIYEPKPIPKLFHSVYAEGPFTSCTGCERSLLDGGVYEIQKVFRGKEVIFEYALCLRCYEEISREFSQESIERVQAFVVQELRPNEETGHCHFCGFPRGLIPSFTLVGMCRQESLIVPSLLMCQRCEERLQGILSQKTRDVQEDFVRDCFPGVPADLDLSPSFGLLSG